MAGETAGNLSSPKIFFLIFVQVELRFKPLHNDSTALMTGYIPSRNADAVRTIIASLFSE